MSTPPGPAYADLVPEGALASEPSVSDGDSQADFSYETDNDEDGVSDGDPPHLVDGLARRPSLSVPPPGQSPTVRQPIQAPAIQPVLPPPVKPTSIVLTHKEGALVDGKVKISRRKMGLNLEKDAWFTPDEFFAEVAEIATRQQDLGLIVVEDRSHTSSRPFLHIGCVYRRSGCPFLLKCLYRKNEGGWVLRSEMVEGTDKLDPKNGSIYHCLHAPNAVREVATPLPYTTKHKLAEQDKPRPAKKARPSLPAPSANYQPVPPRSASNGALNTTYKMPVPGAGRDATASAGASGSAGPSRAGSGGEGGGVGGGRALAPPFTRAQHLAAQVSPALAGGQGGMALGTAYAGHGGGVEAGGLRGVPHPENLERRAPPAPGTFPNSLTPVIMPAGVPQGYLPAAPAPSHHAAYFAAFRPPTYPLPAVRPKFPALPTGCLKMWQHFFHELDPTLQGLAPILASDAVGVTLGGFYNQSERVRRALLDELEKHGATAYLRMSFADKMEGEGRKVFEGLMEKAKERKERAEAEAREKEKERAEREKEQRERARESAAAAAQAAEDAMEVDSVSGVNGAGTPRPATTNGVAPTASDAAPRQPNGHPATQTAHRPIAPAPTRPLSASMYDSAKPAAVSSPALDADVSMLDGPRSVAMAAEPSVTPAPEPDNDEPVIDPTLPDLQIEWVTNPPEMIARMAANGFEYLSIFRRTFFKRRPEERELTGPELRTFFKGYEIESVFADKAGWHITMGGPKEADRAYRQLRGKKKLWGVPLQFDLCAAAGTMGSVQQPPATTEELGSRLRKSLAPAGGTAEDEAKRQDRRTRKAERAKEAKEAKEQRDKAIASGAVNAMTGRSLSQEEAEKARMNDPSLPIPEINYCSSEKILKEELAKNGLPYVQIKPRSQRVVSPRDAVPKRVRYAADWIKDELEAVLANYKGWYLTMVDPESAHVLADYLQDDADYVVTECEAVVGVTPAPTPQPAEKKEGVVEPITAAVPAVGAAEATKPAAETDTDRDGTPMQISDDESVASPPRAAPSAAAAPAQPTTTSQPAAAPAVTQPAVSQPAASTQAPAKSESTSRPSPSPTPSKAPKVGKAIGPFSLPPKKTGNTSAPAGALGASAPLAKAASPNKAAGAGGAAGQDQVARNLAAIPGLGQSASRPPTPSGASEGAGGRGKVESVDDKRGLMAGAGASAAGGLAAGLAKAHASVAGTGSLPGTPVGKEQQPKAPRKSLW